MANVKSAEKRNRQRLKVRVSNVTQKSAMRSKIKDARSKLASEPAQATADVKQAIEALDKAAQKGLIKKQTAARRVSRLQRALNAAQATK